MTSDELNKIIDSAEKDPKKIAAAISGLPDSTLRFKPARDKWSILEMLAHLADMEILYAYRMRQIVADNNPTIAPIDQDAWAKNLGYMEEKAPELIAQFGLLRHHNLNLLRRMRPADLDKAAFHPELNRKVTLAEMIGMLARHGPNHLEQIERIKKQAGGK
ncbi:MAG TPA: DinB family protein [Terriglobales bacterium]|nr:DinB family protein [Terriglobales bacterium]